jgi:FkbM family methyltransferase
VQKKKVLRKLFRFLPASRAVYRICRTYVDWYNGDNDDDLASNGEFRLLESALAGASTVFDVGANVGDWAALALSLNRDLTIHCFEPSEATFRRLASRALPGNVILNNVGLSSEERTSVLHVFQDAAGINSLYRRSGLEEGWGLSSQTTTEGVRLETLDGYCGARGVEQIDFLKVDVEGHELEVFKGGAEMLRAGKIRQIQFEYGGCNIDARTLLKDFFEFFGPFNYEFYKVFPAELRRVKRYDQRLENFQYQNWLLRSPSFRAEGGRP